MVDTFNRWYEKIKHVKISKRLVRQIFGWVFLALGIAGLVLPVLQGVLFLLIALFLLSKDIPLFQRIIDRLRKRYPRMTKKADKISQKLDE